MICEKTRIIWKDQPVTFYDGRVEKRCLVVKELEIGPDIYKPCKLGPELPLSAREAEILFGPWFNHHLLDSESIISQ